jgi:hypothetical protein
VASAARHLAAMYAIWLTCVCLSNYIYDSTTPSTHIAFGCQSLDG